MNAQKTQVIAKHRSGQISIGSNVRQCYERQNEEGTEYWCHLTHAELRSINHEPLPGKNYELIDGQIIKVIGAPDYWIRLDLPEFSPFANLDDTTAWIDPLPVPLPKPRNYAGRRARGISPHWQALLDAARLVAPVLPPEHPLRLAIDRCDAARKGERAEAEIASARAAAGMTE